MDARDTANQTLRAWETAATGGSCCAWVKISEEGANPAVSTERCCTSENCTDAGQRLAHKECSYSGELVNGHCMCAPSKGGLTCAVEATTEPCFSGVRTNGVTPPQRSRCKKCYKCDTGEARREAGNVVVAGDDFCKTLDGPESLCLSCPEGAGLLRLGELI